MSTGKIGVTTENIFPVIKKFLYSDHEIFLRELVSNAIDATQKLKTFANVGEFKGELGDLNVKVTIDKEAGTLTVSDRGIGMDKEDVEKYINQIAFSGAEEFLAKYKESANSIIGHFGLGFYSAFMVAKRVDIHSLSYKEGAKAIAWSCDGSPEYTLTECDKADRGTDIILHIDDDDKQFLEQDRIDGLLKKYCRFLPVPVISGFQKEWKDGKMQDTDKPNVINATEPLWSKKPSELKDEDYIKFYRELMPGMDEPMFWIHLNVDYPFTLTGILYFPNIHSNLDFQKNRIQLYCNQVYVTDQVEGVVPEFMTLMQGVIDSPDIPLNVSRSYLQADTQVKKISSYISKKVAEKLDKLFKDDRKAYEQKWEDIEIFIKYGILTDPKFEESAMKFFIVKDSEEKYFTLEEYKKLVEISQTDKDGNTIWLYATDKEAQYSYIETAKERGYNVLLLGGQLDPHIISKLEQKDSKSRFVRVDSDSIDNLIVKEEKKGNNLTAVQTDILSTLFKETLPEIEKSEFLFQFEDLGEHEAPALIVQNEFMRRMKDMSATQPQMSYFSEMPDNYNFIINTSQDVVKKIVTGATEALAAGVSPLKEQINSLSAEISAAREKNKDAKEASEESKKEIADKEKKVEELRNEENAAIKGYVGKEPLVRQIIDLALLRAGLLTGKNLDLFIKRSVSLMK
jgi:molecular chaperone HtpG